MRRANDRSSHQKWTAPKAEPLHVASLVADRENAELQPNRIAQTFALRPRGGRKNMAPQLTRPHRAHGLFGMEIVLGVCKQAGLSPNRGSPKINWASFWFPKEERHIQAEEPGRRGEALSFQNKVSCWGRKTTGAQHVRNRTKFPVLVCWSTHILPDYPTKHPDPASFSLSI